MFDVRTMLLTVSWYGLVLVVALWLGSGGQGERGLRTWGAALGAQTLANGSFALRGQAPEWLSVVAANVLLMLSLLLYTSAILRFHGRRLGARWVALPPALVAAAWLALRGDPIGRVQLGGLVFGLSSLASLGLLYRLGGGRSPARKLLLGGFSLATLAGFSRVVGGTLAPSMFRDFLASNPFQTATYLLTCAFIIMTSIGFLLLHKEHAEGERESRKKQLEALNRTLSERVAQQVDEIVARSRQVDLLNAELRQKVDERSQELSAVLARMARQRRAQGALAEGSLLAGRFLLESPLGKGGMGVVYRALDSVTGERVAVKVIGAGSADELDALRRFLREAQASARVGHPAVVHARHVDVADGELFIVFELVEGEALDRVLARSGKLPAARVARLGARLAEALAAAHAAGVVHRDLKPANIMLTRGGEGVRLLDFGISKLRKAVKGAGDETRQDLALGTPAYMAPEQVLDSSSVVDKSDVYALGVVLFRMLAGKLPSRISSTQAPAGVDFLPVERLPTVAPAGLAALVLRCLAPAVEPRPSAAELAAALAALARELDTQEDPRTLPDETHTEGPFSLS